VPQHLAVWTFVAIKIHDYIYIYVVRCISPSVALKVDDDDDNADGNKKKGKEAPRRFEIYIGDDTETKCTFTLEDYILSVT
jgi:hypothetical protein